MMRKLWMATTLVLGAGMLMSAGPNSYGKSAQDHDDHGDNGKHKGWDKHEGRGEDNGDGHHDNGKHKGWYKHEGREAHGDWDNDRERIRPGRQYPYGRYGNVRHAYICRRLDRRSRMLVLYDNSNWVVAPYDLDRTRDWEWDRDNVYVYDDDRHPGWYLLFNTRLGRYVHVEFSGVR
ncbi:MAG: hypothetical protein NVS9B13_05650 [Candidatus Acidiferrum sp.]